ncbi:hypothetical protein MYX76_15870 [Desulfobacterota bacterium AH_259_B03_O07]|nr:hypothetical protein [Desulfobacterota bacterium AH_259_B03_O07]
MGLYKEELKAYVIQDTSVSNIYNIGGLTAMGCNVTRAQDLSEVSGVNGEIKELKISIRE